MQVPSEVTSREALWKGEVAITVHEVVYVIAAITMELLEIRLTLYRLNPPRLLVCQTLQYIGMALASIVRKFWDSYSNPRQPEKLPAICAATLTLLDLSCDASYKIAALLVPRHEFEGLYGLLSFVQAIVSHITFSTPFPTMHIFGIVLQTVGFGFVSSSIRNRQFEPVQQQKYRAFGSAAEHVGIFFACISIILRCLNLTMTQALSSSIYLTAGAFCRGTGIWGLILTSVYHSFIYIEKKDKLIILQSVDEIYTLVAAIILVSAVKHYTCFWLVLHTSAFEFAQVHMFSNVLMFVVRRIVYREDGAIFGYKQFPVTGMMATITGFALLSYNAAGVQTLEVDIEDTNV